jgi:2-haloacid dehalogenase
LFRFRGVESSDCYIRIRSINETGVAVKLTDFKVLTFDCYGTLIDWESGIFNALAPLARRAKASEARGQLLQTFAKHESAQEDATPAMPYSQLLSVVYKRLAKEWGVEVTNGEANIFGASVPDWPEFPDSVNALQYLKKHYKLVILSNVDRISFRSSNARLKVDFDAIFTAQDIESYKPNYRNFEYMLKRLHDDFRLERSDILHTAQSLFHDHAPANHFELASAWIDRRHADQGWGATMPPPGTPKYNFRFDSMADLVLAHQTDL